MSKQQHLPAINKPTLPRKLLICYTKKMKTAGDVLSALFDESFVKKAHGHSKLFDSWTDITAKNGIAAASAHSRVKDLNNGILLVEMDHPGWKQILQTKQSKLLNDFRIRFPDMNITGISLMLGKSDLGGQDQTEVKDEPSVMTKPSPVPQRANSTEETTAADIESIKDNELREKLIKLGQTIAERELTLL